MKKLILLMFIALAFTACKKMNEDNAKPSEVEVAFAVSDDAGFKFQPAECPEDENGNVLEPASADIDITIDGTTTTYTPTVFRVDGILYTQSLKLPVPESGTATYEVNKFLLIAANGDTVRATPKDDGEYSEFVSKTVPFNFVVNAFEKAEIPVEVLCFQPEVYTWFGFNWFGITELEIRQKCFFGDICLNGEPYTPEDFNGSEYGTDLGVDVPAIMKVIVRLGDNEVPNSPFTNFGGDLTSALCVTYPDNLNVEDEEFTFELQLWLPDENGIFNWQTYEIYQATDNGEIVAQSDTDIGTGDDNVLDFVVGTCGYNGMADQVFDFLYDEPVAGLGAQTAYAYFDDVNIPCYCFGELGIGNNWGWQIGAFQGYATQTFDIYAAAGNCNIGNGTMVGTLQVIFQDDNTMDVTYNMIAGYGLEQVHLWYDAEEWDGNNIAPGQFDHKQENLGGASTTTISDLPYAGGDIYLIAHAVVSGL